MKQRKFVDAAIAYARGGAGGNGCCSFRREKFVPKGGPDGGDGGRGGNVVLLADPSVDSLVRIHFEPHLTAPDGGHGKGSRKHGRDGRDLVVRVPCGTEIRDQTSGELLCDLADPGARCIVARGGKGGLGNCHWKTSTHQAPTEHTPGEPGEERVLELQLKTVADAALIGFPNAGKSSLLGALTNARPKVAAYAFTTLNPIVGTLRLPDYTEIRIVDVPGLIEGASKGRGMGHLFLRHVERCRLLLHVLDMAGAEDRDPAANYLAQSRELDLHKPGLAEYPTLIVANKMDLPGAADNLAAFRAKTGLNPTPVSALTGVGIAELKSQIAEMIARTKS